MDFQNKNDFLSLVEITFGGKNKYRWPKIAHPQHNKERFVNGIFFQKNKKKSGQRNHFF